MTIKNSKNDFLIKEGLWKGYKLWDLYKAAQTPLHWQKELFDYAKRLKYHALAHHMTRRSKFTKKLNSQLYKISSFEMKDITLVKKICKLKKPIIISTGLSVLSEINEVFKVAKTLGAKSSFYFTA